MSAYRFKDVTAKALEEINLVPGYDKRPAQKKGKADIIGDTRIIKVFNLLINHPELADLKAIIVEKRKKKQNIGKEAKEVFKIAKSKNLPWLTKWGCQPFDDYYHVKASPGHSRYIEYINIVKKNIDPKTLDFVLEVDGPLKPKLYALSVPENYFLPEKKLERFFFHFHFRPAPWQAADHAYQVDGALKPVDTNLSGLLPKRDYYPYGWDYLFSNLWTYMYSLRNRPNDSFVTGLAYQADLAGRDVITIVPMLDIQDLKAEEILTAKGFSGITEGIARWLEKEIQKTNPSFKLKEGAVPDAASIMQDSTIFYPYRVSVSCNSNGMVLMLALMAELRKVKFVKELYLFDPTQLENLHNTWVNSALAWSGREDDKYVRVYTQPFKEFNERNKVIGHQDVAFVPNTLWHYDPQKSKDKGQSLATLRLHGLRSLAEFNLDLLKTQPDFDEDFINDFKSDAKDTIATWRSLHSMIPGLMYTDALQRSGFTHIPASAPIGPPVAEKSLLASPGTAAMPGLDKPIKEAYWSDANGHRLSGGYLKYGEKLRLHLDMAAGMPKLFLELFSSKFEDDKHFNVLLLQTFNAVPGGQALTLDLDTHAQAKVFGDTLIKGKVTNAKDEVLAVIPPIQMDLVPFLPTILAAKNWTVGKQCMERWLSLPFDASKDKHKTAVTDILKMEWALAFPYVKNAIEDAIRDGELQTHKAKLEIVGVIKDLVAAGKLALPANVGDEVALQHTNGTLRNNPAGHQVPEFDMFHFWSISLSPPYITKPLDDFMAAVNACNINFIPIGKIRKVTNTGYAVQLSGVGAYLKDWYDFEGDQGLGYWNVKTNDVGLLQFTQKPNTNKVSNPLFRAYQGRTKKGQDYTNFSDIKGVPFSLHLLMGSDFSIPQ